MLINMLNIQRTVATSLSRIVTPAVLFACMGLASSSAFAGDYHAFYYDSQWNLLQVEDVPNNVITDKSRQLVPIEDSLMPVPMLLEQHVPLLGEGTLSMSRFATMAVYYKLEETDPAPAPGAQNIKSVPTYVEYLGFVQSRDNMTCIGGDPSFPCLFPKRCHCMLSGCCCY